MHQTKALSKFWTNFMCSAFAQEVNMTTPVTTSSLIILENKETQRFGWYESADSAPSTAFYWTQYSVLPVKCTVRDSKTSQKNCLKKGHNLYLGSKDSGTTSLKVFCLLS